MRSRRSAHPATARSRLRCAIYTRKSSEEGLEQEFNSLDAQREACEAYIQSQRHEGWALVEVRYDDGGLSGGSLYRPALQRLLADIVSGRVDLVVVYKVDRLTRSLPDFAKIVEVFDAHSASFVSVTQHFNTTTSMGRLTLNMLLSFAQFEREVTGERIRDKIAASKRKGMWMGGSVPLGYEARDRKLIVEPMQADSVRRIYRLYLELGSVRLVQHQAAIDGIAGKDGRTMGRGALFHLLQNRIYRGEIAHRGNVYRGEHPAIIDQELWDDVQRRLAQARSERRAGGTCSHPSLLAGMLTDPTGGPMTASHATKAGRRYRYYVSSQLITGTREQHTDGLRVPAGAIERVVTDSIARFLTDGPGLLLALRSTTVSPGEATHQRSLLLAASDFASRWPLLQRAAQREALRALNLQIEVKRHALILRIDASSLAVMLGKGSQAVAEQQTDRQEGDSATITLKEPVALRRSGRGMAMLVGSTTAAERSNPTLVRLIAKAWALREALVSSDAPTFTAFAEGHGVSQSYATRLLRMAWLAPDIVEAILDGHQPPGLTATGLMRDTRLPTDWQEQRQAFGVG